MAESRTRVTGDRQEEAVARGLALPASPTKKPGGCRAFLILLTCRVSRPACQRAGHLDRKACLLAQAGLRRLLLLLRAREAQTNHRTLRHDLAVADHRFETPLAHGAPRGIIEHLCRA